MGTINHGVILDTTDIRKASESDPKCASESGDSLSMISNEKCRDSDLDSDSAVSVLNYLNGNANENSLRSSSLHSDKSAIIRLNSELLRAKKSNWEVVDALTTAYDDIRGLRKREQRFNDLLRNDFNEKGENSNQDAIRKTEFKILNTQLEIRNEELSKTKDIVRQLMGERDRLKDECSKIRSDLQLLTLMDRRKDTELAVVQNNLKTLKEQQKVNDDNNFVLKGNAIDLEHQLRTAKSTAQKAEELASTLQETLQLREKELSELKSKLEQAEDENDLVRLKLEDKEAEIENVKSTELAVFKEVESELAGELTAMHLKFSEMKAKSEEDDKKIAEMTEQLKEWERYGSRMSKTMDEYVYEVNTKQLEARREVARYITDLETQLATIKSTQKRGQGGEGHHDLLSNPKNKRYSLPGFPIAQSTFQSDPLLQDDASDSTLSCGSAIDMEEIDMAHSQADAELSDTSSKSKGRRRTLPLTPSDIEALSDEGVMVGDKTGKVFLQRGKCMPRRLTKDSGLGDSVVGKRRSRTTYPWKRNDSKPRFMNSSPVKCEGTKADVDSDSLFTISPLSPDTGSPQSSAADSEASFRIQTKRPKNRENSPIKQVPLRRFLSHDRPRAHRRHAALLLVFRYLTPIELCSLSRICREWRSLSEHPSLWRHVAIVNTHVNNMVLLSISRRCRPLQTLTLKGLRRTGRETMDPSDNCYLEKGLEYILKVAADSLTTLHLQDCENLLTDRCLLLTGSHCRNVQSFTYISEYYPACPESLWSLWNCRNLVCLRVPPMTPSDHPNRFNDKSCETIANCWPGLRKLTIGGTGITTTGLVNISKGCLRLQELELDRTHYITEETAHSMCLAGLKGLQVLMLSFTPVSPAAIKRFYATCPRLEYMAIHIGISDYFSDTTNPANVRKYTRMINKIEALRKENSDLAHVLRIKAYYG